MNLSNLLSLLRAPLALLFLIDSSMVRFAAIVLAMLTDIFDGYLARRYQWSSQFGAILDPAMDKFFVFFALGVFLFERTLQPWEACAMISRDFALCLFAVYLSLSGRWHTYEFKAIRWGKATTALQFFVLIALTFLADIPVYIFWLFILFGLLAFLELCQVKKQALT